MTRKLAQINFLFILFLISGTATAEVQSKTPEIIVGFVKDTPQKDITSFQKKYNLKVIKPFKRICAVRYRVDSKEECKKTISEIKQEKIVRYVEMNAKPQKK